MAKYLLDTDVIFEWLRRNERVVSWLKARDGAGDFLACTPVSIAELYAGLRPREEFIIGDLLRVLHCVDLDARVGRKAGRYRLTFGTRGRGRGRPDRAAHVHGLVLCTRNLRHYPMRDVRKLRV